MKKILLILLTITFSIHSFSQSQFVHDWDYSFGGTGADVSMAIQQTADGGYILGGYSTSGISGNKTQPGWGGEDYWIVKIDSLGIYQWDKTFGGTGTDGLVSLQQTSDGGYILGGYSFSGISGNKTQACWGSDDYWIVKIDSLGNLQWDKTFGGTGSDGLRALQQTSDGGYILGGTSTSGIGGNKTQSLWGAIDYWIVKIDVAGNMMWDKDFGTTSNDFLASLEQTSDGGYILGGTSFGGISGNKTQPLWGASDYWIVRIDSLGNLMWEKDIGGTADDLFYSVHETNDRKFILGGISFSGIGGNKTQPNFGAVDYWIVKVDSFGNVLWDKGFGGINGEDVMGNIALTSDGGFLISGMSYSPVSGNKSENNLGMEQGWMVKTDSLGIIQWDKTIFTPGHDEAGWAVESMICLPESGTCYPSGCFVALIQLSDSTGIGGFKTQPSWGGPDYWVVKLCDSTFHVGIQAEIPERTFSLFPNPATGELRIQNAERINNLEIYDAWGQKCLTLDPNLNKELVIDISKWKSGIYFVKILDEKNNLTTQKIVKP